MASSIMSIGHSPRRRPSLDAVSTAERAVAAGLVVTLTLSAALVLFDARSSGDVTQVAIVPEVPTVIGEVQAQPAADATFVESGDTSGAVATNDAVGTVTEDAAFAITVAELPDFFVTAGAEPVNMRGEPGVDATIVGQVAPGDAALATTTGRMASRGDEQWYEVDYLGTTGWVRADLVAATDAH